MMSTILAQNDTKTQKVTFFKWARYLLIALPIISLAFNAISLLRFGTDIPYWDDWRQYQDGNMGRIDFSYLMTSANDTLYPIGLLLDSLAFRFLDGNTITYQFLSLIFILGSLLALQWRLITICTTNNMVRACAFSLSLLMLQPDTYWGLQNLAYHQALPLVCILSILNIALTRNLKLRYVILPVTILGFISGFSYISGAFATLSLCASLFICHYFIEKNDKKMLLVCALSLAPAAIICTLMQVWVIVGIQHGTHIAGVGMAYPWESDFWFFLLGKIGRSLMLPTSTPALSFLTTALVIALTSACVLSIIIKFVKNKCNNPLSHHAFVFLSLSIVTFVYLLLVAAGRTNIRSELTQAPLDIFLFGFQRFHFFWVTLLWPWLAIYLLSRMSDANNSNLKEKLITALFLFGAFFAVLKTPIINHESFYQTHMLDRLEGIKCLQTKIQTYDNLVCPELFPTDLTQALNNAKKAGASFTRTLTYIPTPFGSDRPAAFFKTSNHANQTRAVNLTYNNQAGDLSSITTKTDPQLYFSTDNPKEMQSCRTLEITANLKAIGPERSQLFYLPINNPILSEANSKKSEIDNSEDFKTISFILTSDSGFQDSLRFDPVMNSQIISIKGIEVRCREKTLK
ncbi:hypothetical protein OH720_08710 [Pseudomonas sp. WJP1]|uniref:hypothetical protein n=1 Tax=Pseudomonas sp. WJP1 TaxID=2986947 RepID=UPI00234B030D|nr:hypothetical protein [Pseudomonas sp. WJP1]WCM53076.1 hypothetical protein OH720_08710 [Pseudomonas sp. WJP1]